MIRQLLLAALVGLALGAPSKIDSNLEKVLAKGPANVIVTFLQETQPVLDRINAMRFQSRGAKITAMKEQLEQLAASSQKEVIALLKARSASFESFWINNRLIVNSADLPLVNSINALPNVLKVREEIIVQLDEPIPADSEVNAEWGVEKIEAEAAWALPGGNNGAGVVVSNIDTGVRYTHEALKNNFRADHGWFDPYSRSANPIDQNGHGSHTMGTIAGSGGIGVAPGAQWVACRGCDTSSCTEAALTSCGQWTACPTNADGSGADCSKAPVLSSNSWGGGQNDNWYNSIVQAWHTADITPIFSQGNSGSGCGTANSPGDMTNVIGVGSTTSNDGISTFSSRGPARNGAIKPDISAPGQNVRSSWNTGDTAYNTISGTSMACPHVAGTVALLKAHNGNLRYEQIKSLVNNNAQRTGLGQAAACGGVPNDQFPNNVYGHGRINARASLAAAIAGF